MNVPPSPQGPNPDVLPGGDTDRSSPGGEPVPQGKLEIRYPLEAAWYMAADDGRVLR
jgi:hypothetical protein